MNVAECFYNSCTADMETLQVTNVTPLMYLEATNVLGQI